MEYVLLFLSVFSSKYVYINVLSCKNLHTYSRILIYTTEYAFTLQIPCNYKYAYLYLLQKSKVIRHIYKHMHMYKYANECRQRMNTKYANIWCDPLVIVPNQFVPNPLALIGKHS